MKATDIGEMGPGSPSGRNKSVNIVIEQKPRLRRGFLLTSNCGSAITFASGQKATFRDFIPRSGHSYTPLVQP
jgi:hypothetical protein